jgi:erythromycin esterase-like protein
LPYCFDQVAFVDSLYPSTYHYVFMKAAVTVLSLLAVTFVLTTVNPEPSATRMRFTRQAASPSSPAREATDADRILHDLCAKTVAMLGESPLHGFGKTLEFKVALVPRLIDDCHYNAFFIESGVYDFLNIQKRLASGQEVTEPMLAAAVGGIWATREMQPLISYLLENAKSGRVTLGGLDDQLARDTYAQREMPSDLVAHLPGDEKARCLGILKRHMLWQYTGDSPYSATDKALILGCLDGIETSLTKAPPTAIPFRDYHTAMVEGLKKLLAWDFRQDVPKGVDEDILDRNERERWMYTNFHWLQSRLPPHSKVIVWAANTHLAKDLSGVPGEEGLVSFGSYVHQEFKSDAFALGFSEYSGSYAMAGQPVRPLGVGPTGSLEALAFADRESHTAYLSLKDLQKLGPTPARVRTDFKTAQWSEVFDGMLIFREEHSPGFLGR